MKTISLAEAQSRFNNPVSLGDYVGLWRSNDGAECINVACSSTIAGVEDVYAAIADDPESLDIHGTDTMRETGELEILEVVARSDALVKAQAKYEEKRKGRKFTLRYQSDEQKNLVTTFLDANPSISIPQMLELYVLSQINK